MKNITDLYRITPAERNRDMMAVAKLTSDTFAGGGYLEEISQQYFGNSHYDWKTSRLIWDEETLIHHWGVWDYQMRLEKVFLRVAGVGAVTTLTPYRNKGVMQWAAEDSLQAMQENNYDISILRGRHYVKFGYRRAWNYVTYKLKSEEIPEIKLKYTYELLGPERMREIEGLYNTHYQNFSGTCVRPTYRMLQADGMQAYGWVDQQGKLRGYVRAVPTDDKKALQCLEAVGEVDQCLAVMLDLFSQNEYETMDFFTLPHDHLILRHFRQKACVVETRYFLNTGWRVKVVNLMSTLGKLHPLLTERLQNSRYAGWTGSFQLDAGEQKATLHIENGKVRFIDASPGQHTIRGGPDIARFLIGSDDATEIIQQAGISSTEEAADLAGILFPNLHPVMSQWDEF